MIGISILEALKHAINKTYEESDDYFNPSRGRERSMVFRIAHHLAMEIEERSNLFVDIEATRCNGAVKRLYGTNSIVRPDLIVHERNGKGYLVAEFKCNKNSAEKREDYAKLSLFTYKNKPKPLANNCPTYEIGIFVYLGCHEKDVRITLFNNGEKIREQEDVSLYNI